MGATALDAHDERGERGKRKENRKEDQMVGVIRKEKLPLRPTWHL